MKKPLFEILKTEQISLNNTANKGVRKYWTEKEDNIIKNLVEKYGDSDWSLIAKELSKLSDNQLRNSKQCRERYINHLSPQISKDKWTREEEKILFTKHMELGNKWSKISHFLPQRTLNSIKNHFYSKFRKFLRRALRQLYKENLIKDKPGYTLNSEKLYLVIKKNRITFQQLTQEKLLNIILENYNTLQTPKCRKQISFSKKRVIAKEVVKEDHVLSEKDRIMSEDNDSENQDRNTCNPNEKNSSNNITMILIKQETGESFLNMNNRDN